MDGSAATPATNRLFIAPVESGFRYIKCMAVLNVIAAVLLALMPALEPCRLHGMFKAPPQAAAEKPHHSCGQRHSRDTEPEQPKPCPDCPDSCTHLSDADGLPALAVAHVLIPALPGVWAPLVLPALALTISPASQYQHPPPTGVALVGTTNLRI